MIEATEASVGARLRRAREQRDQPIEAIARLTRIPMRALHQIEEDRLEELPAAPYSVGFVKAYARAVGLDPQALGQAFRGEFDRARRGSGRIVREPYMPDDPGRLPPRWLAITAALLAMVLLAGAAVWRSGVLTGDGPDARARLAAGAEPVAPAPAATPAPAAEARAPVPTAAPSAAAAPVVLTARQDCWIAITTRGGAALFKGTLAAGRSFAVPADAADPVIHTGRPEALDVTVGGRAVAPLGAPAAIVSDVSLKPAALLARGTAPAAGGPVSIIDAPAAPAGVPPASLGGAGVPPAFTGAAGR